MSHRMMFLYVSGIGPGVIAAIVIGTSLSEQPHKVAQVEK